MRPLHPATHSGQLYKLYCTHARLQLCWLGTDFSAASAGEEGEAQAELHAHHYPHQPDVGGHLHQRAERHPCGGRAAHPPHSARRAPQTFPLLSPAPSLITVPPAGTAHYQRYARGQGVGLFLAEYTYQQPQNKCRTHRHCNVISWIPDESRMPWEI